MLYRSILRRLFVLAVLFSIALCCIEANAQRRTRRSRRVTNPIVSTRATSTTTTDTSAQPGTSTTTGDPRIVSTADDQSGDAGVAAGARTSSRSRSGSGTLEEEHDSMRGRMNRLATQVTVLTEKLTRMEEQQRTLVDLERLSRAEQRAETLRAQLRDVYMKEADLQARADQLEFDIKPENIERMTANTGSTRPEELRETRRRQLENERTRVRTQLDLMTQSRTRLESAIASADAEADRIRQRLDETPGGASASQTGTSDNSSGIEGTSNTEAPVPTTPPPSPTGTPR
jgi:chromosome segregation ATPase